MRAFGRDVAVEVIGGVVVIIVVGVAAVASDSIQRALGSFAASLSIRESVAWILVTALALLVVVLVRQLRFLRAESRASSTTPQVPGTAEITLHGGRKPSVTLTHRGGQTTYAVDGQILQLTNGAANPLPAPFRCQLHVGAITDNWEATLKDGDWATIILGSIEELPGNDWHRIGTVLRIRRGALNQTMDVPDSGAIIELRIKANPPLAAGGDARRICVMRDPGAPTAVVVPFNAGPV